MSIITLTHDVEHKLAEGMRLGSREVFDQLYRNYAPALLGYISRLTCDEKSAEEALTKSFLEIWNNRQHFDPGSERLFTWMLKITKSITIGFIPENRYLTNKKTESMFSHDITDDRETIANEHTNIYTPVNTPINNLQQHLLNLMHFNNYSIVEASAILKIEENIVRSALRTAIHKLKTAR